MQFSLHFLTISGDLFLPLFPEWICNEMTHFKVIAVVEAAVNYSYVISQQRVRAKPRALRLSFHPREKRGPQIGDDLRS